VKKIILSSFVLIVALAVGCGDDKVNVPVNKATDAGEELGSKKVGGGRAPELGSRKPGEPVGGSGS